VLMRFAIAVGFGCLTSLSLVSGADAQDAPSRPASGPTAEQITANRGVSPDDAQRDASPQAAEASEARERSGRSARERMRRLAREQVAAEEGSSSQRLNGEAAGGSGKSEAPIGPSSERPTEPNSPAGEGASSPAGSRPVGGGEGSGTGEAGAFYENRERQLGGSADGQSSDTGSAFSGTGGWVLDTLTALGVVIGLILLGKWGWTKLSGQVPASGGAGSRAVELLSRTAIAPKNHVLLLRVGQRVLVVSDSPTGMRTLTELAEPDEVADLLTTVTAQQSDSISNQFRQTLSRAGAGLDESEWDQEVGRDTSEHHFDRSRDAVSSLLSRVRTFANRGGGP